MESAAESRVRKTITPMVKGAGSPRRFVPSMIVPTTSPAMATPAITENGLPFSGGKAMPARVRTTMLDAAKPMTVRMASAGVPVSAERALIGTAISASTASCGPRTRR